MHSLLSFVVLIVVFSYGHAALESQSATNAVPYSSTADEGQLKKAVDAEPKQLEYGQNSADLLDGIDDRALISDGYNKMMTGNNEPVTNQQLTEYLDALYDYILAEGNQELEEYVVDESPLPGNDEQDEDKARTPSYPASWLPTKLAKPQDVSA